MFLLVDNYVYLDLYVFDLNESHTICVICVYKLMLKVRDPSLSWILSYCGFSTEIMYFLGLWSGYVVDMKLRTGTIKFMFLVN